MSKSQIVKTYVFRKHGTTAVKIGRTGNVEKRKRTLESLIGCLLETVAIIDSDIEQALHFRFCNLRTIGEWFDDSSEAIQNFVGDSEAVETLILAKGRTRSGDRRQMSAEQAESMLNHIDNPLKRPSAYVPTTPVPVYPPTNRTLAINYIEKVLEIATLFAISKAVAQRKAVEKANELYGVDFTNILRLAPAQHQS